MYLKQHKQCIIMFLLTNEYIWKHPNLTNLYNYIRNQSLYPPFFAAFCKLLYPSIYCCLMNVNGKSLLIFPHCYFNFLFFLVCIFTFLEKIFDCWNIYSQLTALYETLYETIRQTAKHQKSIQRKVRLYSPLCYEIFMLPKQYYHQLLHLVR